MSERSYNSSLEKAILVQIDFKDKPFEERLTEFQELAKSAGAKITHIITGTRSSPDVKYFVGVGKASEIQQEISSHQATLVLFNHQLSPSQERNLEKLLGCRVIDRTGLILDIFAQRARSFAGKLQVELAQLKHLSSRLTRGWTHLERQKGGIGLRGPGETQLETDRRLIRNRIKIISKRLEKLHQQRQLSKQQRIRHNLPTVTLAGYTNAGKSTLFNQLTASNLYAADQLFATLDSTSRRLMLPGFGPIILSDTVGFLNDLPHDLIEAFKATLEETREADLILHVVDSNQQTKQNHIDAVNHVLKEIEADHIPQLFVFNKIDLLDTSDPHIDYDQSGKPNRIWLSALNKNHISLLLQAIAETLMEDQVHCCIKIPPNKAQKRSSFYEQGYILDEKCDQEGNYLLEVKFPKTNYISFLSLE